MVGCGEMNPRVLDSPLCFSEEETEGWTPRAALYGPWRGRGSACHIHHWHRWHSTRGITSATQHKCKNFFWINFQADWTRIGSVSSLRFRGSKLTSVRRWQIDREKLPAEPSASSGILARQKRIHQWPTILSKHTSRFVLRIFYLLFRFSNEVPKTCGHYTFKRELVFPLYGWGLMAQV